MAHVRISPLFVQVAAFPVQRTAKERAAHEMLLQGDGLLPTMVSALPCSCEIYEDLGLCIMAFVLM